MDPNLFHIDWERTFEALAGIIVLSFFVERACALLFESRWWIRKFEDAEIDGTLGETAAKPGATGSEETPAEALAKKEPALMPAAPQPTELLPGQKYPLKEFIGFVVALAVCWAWDFDALSIVLLSDETRLVGVVLTAGVVAGGSKASIKLFHDVLHIGSSATQKRRAGKNQAATS